LVALTGIEPEGCQFSPVQLGPSGCVFSTGGIPGCSETPPRTADVTAQSQRSGGTRALTDAAAFRKFSLSGPLDVPRSTPRSRPNFFPMVFTKRLREGVRNGSITCSVRIWKRPHVKVGGRYQIGEGEIEVDSIEQIAIQDITRALAIESGFLGVIDLLKVAMVRARMSIWSVFTTSVPVPEGPRRARALAARSRFGQQSTPAPLVAAEAETDYTAVRTNLPDADILDSA